MVRRARADRERQSMAIHNGHDFHAFATLRSSDFQPAALGHNEGCVDEAFFFVQCTSIAKLVSNIRQHAPQNSIAAPSLKAPMHSFVVRVALRLALRRVQSFIASAIIATGLIVGWARTGSERPEAVCRRAAAPHRSELLTDPLRSAMLPRTLQHANTSGG